MMTLHEIRSRAGHVARRGLNGLARLLQAGWHRSPRVVVPDGLTEGLARRTVPAGRLGRIESRIVRIEHDRPSHYIDCGEDVWSSWNEPTLDQLWELSNYFHDQADLAARQAPVSADDPGPTYYRSLAHALLREWVVRQEPQPDHDDGGDDHE